MLQKVGERSAYQVRRQITSFKPRRIAIFRALQLGDLLCTVPALRALRAACPHSEITLIGLPWARGFVERFSFYLDHFIEFPGCPGLPEQAWSPLDLARFINSVRKKKFDVILQMHGSGPIVNRLVNLCGGLIAAGYFLPGHYRPNAEWFMPFPANEPEIRQHLALMDFLGIATHDEELEFPLFDRDREELNELRRSAGLQPGNYICVHPGAQLSSRRWLPQRFATVADALAKRGWQIVLTGTAAEKYLTQEVLHHMQAPAINLAGQTSLGGVAALISQAQLLVANDTGVSHIAAALKVPSVIVACGSDVARWAPLNSDLHRVLWHAVTCRPCSYRRCPIGHPCASGVSAAAVQHASLQITAKNRLSANAAERDLCDV
ncbi:MAG: glycosyltransferase family 9 protein [Gammaproteobacteria bacterium]|nr:glycosyltransferase family 9 protein [Gammaproteobacteria bacterium]